MIGRNRDNKASEANTVYLVGSDRISTRAARDQPRRQRGARPAADARLRVQRSERPEQLYYRSDHYSYAAKGIPIIFFTTGLHPDYHANTDEVSKIEFDKMTRVAQLRLRDRRRASRTSITRRCATTRGARAGKGTPITRDASAPGHLPDDLRQPGRLRHHHSAAAVLRRDVRRVAARDRPAVRACSRCASWSPRRCSAICRIATAAARS